MHHHHRPLMLKSQQPLTLNQLEPQDKLHNQQIHSLLIKMMRCKSMMKKLKILMQDQQVQQAQVLLQLLPPLDLTMDQQHQRKQL